MVGGPACAAGDRRPGAWRLPCDIKGAAAALLAAANAGDGDAAFLFSSDEEANDPRCIAAFLARGIPYEAVLVAEPTRARRCWRIAESVRC